MALALYLATTLCILTAWDRWVQRVSRVMAIALVALPLLFTGNAMFTGRVYAPIDLPFAAEPLKDYARAFDVAKPHNIALSDLHCQIIPWQKSLRYALAHGEWPLWNPFILCGDILAAAAQPAVYDPVQLLGLVLPLPDALTFGATMTFFLAAFFTWAFARALELSEIAALVAAAGFSFCGMMAFFVGWPLGRSWAFLPLVLLGTRLLVRGRSPALLTLAFVLAIFAGHPESVLHVVAIGALYGVFELWASRHVAAIGRSVVRAAVAGVLALLLTAIYLLPFLEAMPQTLEHEIRDKLYANTPYAALVKPESRAARIGRTFVPGYHSEELDPLSARVGPAVLLLALIGAAWNWRRVHCWFFLLLATVGLCATFGIWPVAHGLHALPLFRIAINERLAFAAAFALSMLAAYAIDRIPPRYALVMLAVVLLQRSAEDGHLYPVLRRDAFYPRVPLLATIPGDGRVAGLHFAFTPNNSALYELEDARGYQAMTNKRLTDTYVLWSVYQVAWFNRIDDLRRPFLSFLNVRYAFATTDAPKGWIVKARDRETRLLENTNALPRAFIPRVVHYERDGEHTLASMKQAKDFEDAAWIEAKDFDPHAENNGPGRLTMLRSGLRYLIDAEMDRPGWVIVSATAWKGWRATIDGHRVTPRFANHAFLGVYVPEGSHRVLLEYLPESFEKGRLLSFGTLGLLAIAAVCYRARRACLRSFSTSPHPSR